MQSTVLRVPAFSTSSLRAPACVRTAPASRTSLTVKAAQDVKGIVVGTKMAKTIVVEVERLQADVTYQKRNKVTKRFIVHDENGMASLGDYVRLSGTRPLSKTKRFAVTEIIRAAN